VIDIEIQISRKRLILKDFRELQSREAAEADVEPWVRHRHASHQRNNEAPQRHELEFPEPNEQ
jgi:hypothetical protein